MTTEFNCQYKQTGGVKTSQKWLMHEEDKFNA